MPQRDVTAISSTSWHRLSGDRRLSKFERVSWVLLNVLNNSFPRSRIDETLKQLRFSLSEIQLDNLWEKISETASPARRLCDLFWLSLPWRAIARELDGKVSVLDVGCGSGGYGDLIRTCVGVSFERYRGVDIEASKQWTRYSDHPQFSFSIGNGSDAHKFLPGCNLIVTQSALEHFDEDLSYFRHVSAYVSTAKAPVLQIHLIPSASCISTYLWHGVRMYTPRTISKITKLFGPETNAYLFSLGGAHCNSVHRRFITLPNLRYGFDLRERETSRYRRELRAAILSDFRGAQRNPSFYALLLESNFSKNIVTSTC